MDRTYFCRSMMGSQIQARVYSLFHLVSAAFLAIALRFGWREFFGSRPSTLGAA